jgi:2-dehydro-3-deoxy-D-arabinonate dehydratase
MKICRFARGDDVGQIGLFEGDVVLDLSAAGVASLTALLENESPLETLREIDRSKLKGFKLSEVKLLAPVEGQEVWAAGVTYLRSKAARMEESDFSANAYDRVYEAERPELFFKALPEKVVAPGEPVGIRRDARWSVPEPELALVINSRGKISGFTIGNDMSSRDIEGENLLYLPQAKIYERSCALGPCITLCEDPETARDWRIALKIMRAGSCAFSGETSAAKIKRSFTELVEFLFRSQRFQKGAVLLTGTGVVPPDDFTLAEGDLVEIEISGIGTLRNPVIRV